MFGNEALDFLARYESEYLDVFLGILVAYVQPELVEFVWRCVARVEPDVA